MRAPRVVACVQGAAATLSLNNPATPLQTNTRAATEDKLTQLLTSARQRWDAMDAQERAAAVAAGAVGLVVVPKVCVRELQAVAVR